MTDKIKEVLSDAIKFDPEGNAYIDKNQAAHRLNQMLIEARIDELARLVDIRNEPINATNRYGLRINPVKKRIRELQALKAEKEKT